MSKSFNTIHEFSNITVKQTHVTVQSAGTNLALRMGDSGGVIMLNSTSGSTITLPTASSGINYKFIVSNTGAHSITSMSSNIYGKLMAGSTGGILSITSAKSVIRTTSGSMIGDDITLQSDGINYYVSGSLTGYNGAVFM